MPSVVQMRPVSRVGDHAFRWLCMAMVFVVLGLVLLVGWTLWRGSAEVFGKFGFGFLTNSAWDPVKDHFGALPFIFGTLVSSLLGLAIATPLAVATAIYLTELAPTWIRTPLAALVEMLAAVPSVIFGLWAIFVLLPWIARLRRPAHPEDAGLDPFFPGAVHRAEHPGGVADHRRDDPAHHHERLARDLAQRARPPA